MASPREEHHARQSRLRALLQSLTFTKKKIDKTFTKAGALGRTESLTPSLFQKLTGWMEQIAGLREKENDVISEIKAIEEKHNQMRKAKKLRKATPAPEKKQEPTLDDEEEKPGRSWFWMLLLWMMMSSNKRKNNDRPQNG